MAVPPVCELEKPASSPPTFVLIWNQSSIENADGLVIFFCAVTRPPLFVPPAKPVAVLAEPPIGPGLIPFVVPGS